MKKKSILDHQRAPLFEAMLRYHKRVRGNFHVPGHKMGHAFDANGFEHFRSLLQLDFTEVADLDDLHDAHGVIAEAQVLAADAFGAEQSLFLVGGTTAGNLAAVLHLCRPGEEILLQRSSHQSLFHGCLLADAKPIYMNANIDERTGFEQPLDPNMIDEVLRENPHIKGVFITSPSYFGVNQPIREIAQVCHRYDIPLVVDEAHGAHYAFHRDLPPSAMDSGADLAIQSTHKMLSSMTMSSMLHIQGNRVQRDEIKHWLRVVESSSPSYPLMASLDLARRNMVLQGEAALDRVWGFLTELREKLKSVTRLREMVLNAVQDPFKMTFVDQQGNSGRTLSSFLEQRGVFAELADSQRLLLVFSMGTTKQECELLLETLLAYDRFADHASEPINRNMFPIVSRISKPVYTFAEIRQQNQIDLPLAKATGRLAAEMIIPYPPGIPVILPGERITQDVMEQLVIFMEQGGRVRGVCKENEPYIRVLK